MQAPNGIRHSRSGTLSLLLFLVAVISAAGVLFLGNLYTSHGYFMRTALGRIVVPLLAVVGACGASLGGIIFGIVGVKNRESRRSLAWTGLILNLAAAIVFFLFALASLMAASMFG
ncbi:MAG: hypothetical protein V1873_03440 [Verrucomicrobiota bacterium]